MMIGSYTLLFHQQKRSNSLSSYFNCLFECLIRLTISRLGSCSYAFSLINHNLVLQATIRQLLMLSMDDPNKKIRTVIAIVVTLIANYDWPEEWPELLPHLMKLISDKTNVNGGMLLRFSLWNLKFFCLFI